jgi:polyisoprenoid-binding protein YceI
MSTATTAGSSTWNVDSVHSSVGFTARHMMITKVRGNFTQVKGEVQLPEGSSIPLSIAAEIVATSLDTHDDQRDGHLRSADFFDVEHYPQLTFESTSIAKVNDTAFTVIGDLTIRSTTKSVTFPVEVEGQATDPQGNRRIGYSAQFRVDRRDFGLTFNRGLETGGVLISNEVDIELDIQAVASVSS